MKKTLLLTVIRGMIARNLLQNEFFHIVRERYNIIILTPAAKDERFINEFQHPNVRFIYFDAQPHSKIDTIFVGLHKYLVYSKYIGFKLRYGIRGLTDPKDLSLMRYYAVTAIFKPLSKIKILREWVKWIDYHFVQRKEVARFRQLLRKEKPDVVISTSIMSDIESALIKAARKERICTIGMPKSWDNPSRAAWRARVDELIVWSQFMKEQAQKYQNYSADCIHIIGIPQFDFYTDSKRLWSRERFCHEFNLDPQKPIIFYTSGGKAMPEDAEIAHMAYELIQSGEIGRECQLLVRPHYSYAGDEKKFASLIGKKDVSIDHSHNPSDTFRDHGDYSWEHRERFMNCLYHAALVVNVASTITLDAVAFDKPIVNPTFDGYPKAQANVHPLRLFYESDHYRGIIKTGATKLANSEKELRAHIVRYIHHPEYESQERARLRERFCYRVDGKSGQRLAEVVARVLASHS
jgi:hypothetical protein